MGSTKLDFGEESMKISLNWIKDYVDIRLSIKDLSHRLSMAGFPVEDIFNPNPFPGVVIGHVKDVQKHPNADKLSLTKVDIGKEILSIVCGAPNVEAGQYVPVATVGTLLQGGLEIKQAKIRGEASFGMICSKSELGFESGKSDGIWPLEENASTLIGQPFAEYLHVSDTIITLDVTSNRPDCLSMLGIAREIAVIQECPIKIPEPNVPETDVPIERLAAVEIVDPEGCGRYAARVIRNVKMGPSPEWLVKRLESVGVRSISNVVDITNYVMLESGQPLHAFDYDTIAGHKIIVRSSRPGESFQTLDQKIHPLTEPAIMICDAEKAVALGGIMGGLNSEISDRTVNVLLESAYFNPGQIRRSMKKLDMMSDASLRFSRGVDPEGMIYAINRAAQLMAELTGGTVANGVIDVRATIQPPRTIRLRHAAVTRLLGQPISTEIMDCILRKLECVVKPVNDLNFEVVPPSFRTDLNAEHDLIEEIARIYGYENLPSSTQAPVYYIPSERKNDAYRAKTHQALQSCGFNETVTYSMVNPVDQLFISPVVDDKIVRLLNPINEDLSVMRWSLLPNLLEVVRNNLFKKNQDVRIYEIGKIFLKNSGPDHGNGELPDEEWILAGCACGNRNPVRWDSKPAEYDFYDLKTVIQALLDQFMLEKIQFNPYNENTVFTEWASEIVFTDNARSQRIGHFGKMKRNVLKHFDIEADVWAFEINLFSLYQIAAYRPVYQSIPRFPFIRRDLAVTVDRKIPAGLLVETIRKNGGSLLCDTDVFDLYTGDQISNDKKSLAFSLRFQSTERTLVEEEIDSIMKTILQKLEKQFEAQIR
jgi:phenylalanyl-tRNA synthetase beta chain